MILLKAGAKLFDLGRLSSPRYFLYLEAVQVVSKIALFAGGTFEMIFPVHSFAEIMIGTVDRILYISFLISLLEFIFYSPCLFLRT